MGVEKVLHTKQSGVAYTVQEDEYRSDLPEKTILEEAQGLVTGARDENYGPPEDNMLHTAQGINFILDGKMKDGCKVEDYDVAMIMMVLKLSRECFKHQRDNPVDIAGYAHCLQRVWNAREAKCNP